MTTGLIWTLVNTTNLNLDKIKGLLITAYTLTLLRKNCRLFVANSLL